MADNLLFYGDNLDVLRRHIDDESVDLVYLDPPFKSDQSYNVLFAEGMAVKQQLRSKPLRIRGSGTRGRLLRTRKQ